MSFGILFFCSLPNLLALGLWGISLVAPDIATLHMQLAGHTIVIPDIGIASMYDTLVFAFGLFQQIGDRTLSMANPTDLFFGITSLFSLVLSQFFYCVLIVAALRGGNAVQCCHNMNAIFLLRSYCGSTAQRCRHAFVAP